MVRQDEGRHVSFSHPRSYSYGRLFMAKPAPRLVGTAMGRLWKRTGLGLLLLLVLLSLGLAVTQQGRAAVKTALFIPQVVPAIPVKPQEWFTAEPLRQRVHFPIPEGEGTADIYRPAGDGPYAAVLLFLGVAPAGPDDPRITNLGEALARGNLVAMFYWSPVMLERRLHPPDIQNLVAAFQYLRDEEYVDPERVGMGGFCVGASFVLMAAAQEPIRDQVSYVNAFGPYFDMEDLLRAIASRSRFYGEEHQPWEVDSLTYEVFVRELTAALEDREEARQLQEAFLDGDAATLDPEGLSTPARVIYHLLQGVPLEEVDAYLAQLPGSLSERFRELSPSAYVRGLKAPVLLMHDQDDPLVPADESRRLQEALPLEHQARYTEFEMFRHMDPTRALNPLAMAIELGKFFRHMHIIFQEAS